MAGDGYGLDYVDARCHRCEFRTDSVAGLRGHIAEEHGEGWSEPERVCPECGSPMRRSAALDRWVCLNYGGCELSCG
jgi:hypothetical protein